MMISTTLANGLKIISHQRFGFLFIFLITIIHRSSPTIGFGVFTRTGSAMDPSGLSGLAHLTEHLVFKVAFFDVLVFIKFSLLIHLFAHTLKCRDQKNFRKDNLSWHARDWELRWTHSLHANSAGSFRILLLKLRSNHLIFLPK